MNRRFGQRGFALFSVALIVLASCSGTPSAPTTNESPAKEKVLVIAQAGDLGNIDNQQAIGATKNALINLYDWQWIRYGTKEVAGNLVSDTAKYEPAIIESWSTELLPDGKAKNTLKVRKGAKFHSGNPITAHDFVWTMQRRGSFKNDGIHQQLQQLFVAADPASFYAQDDSTVVYITRRNMPLNLQPWTQRTYYDSKLVEASAPEQKADLYKTWLTKNPAASGPFKLQSWTPGVEMVQVRNPDYWGPRPKVDKLVWRVVPELSSRLLLLKNGDVDIALDLPPAEIASLQKSAGVKVISGQSQNKVIVGFGVTHAPYDNKTVRQALSYAFPYDAVLKSVYLGEAQPLTGPIPAPVGGSLSQPAYKTDLAKAKTLLQQAGLPEKYKFSLSFSQAFPAHQAVGVLFQANLREIGYDMELNRLPAAQYETQSRERKLGLFFQEALSWVPDGGYSIILSYVRARNTNYTACCNAAIDKLSQEIDVEIDDKVRNAKIAEAVRMIVDEAPEIWVAQPNFTLAMRSNISGYVIQNTELHHFWLVDKK